MKLTLCTKTSTLINVTLMVHTYFPKILTAINMAFAFQKLVENLNLYFLCPLRSYPTMTPVLTFPDIPFEAIPFNFSVHKNHLGALWKIQKFGFTANVLNLNL